MTTSRTAPPGDDHEATPHVAAQGRPLVPIRPPLAPHPRPRRLTPSRRQQHRSLPAAGPVVTIAVWAVAVVLLLLLLL